MKKIIAIWMIALLLLGCTACRRQRDDLKFYVVRGSEVAAGGGESGLLSQARRNGRIAFTGADIKGWDWAHHQVELKGVAVRGGETDGGSRLFQATAEDLFLLVLGNRVIYSGGFAKGSATVADLQPLYIEDGEGDTFYLRLNGKFQEGADPRADETLYKYLTAQQMLVSAVNTDEDL